MLTECLIKTYRSIKDILNAVRLDKLHSKDFKRDYNIPCNLPKQYLQHVPTLDIVNFNKYLTKRSNI